MDLHTLIQAQMELMGNDQPVASCGLHGATRRDVIEQAIEYLQDQATIFKKVKQKEEEADSFISPA